MIIEVTVEMTVEVIVEVVQTNARMYTRERERDRLSALNQFFGTRNLINKFANLLAVVGR